LNGSHSSSLGALCRMWLLAHQHSKLHFFCSLVSYEGKPCFHSCVKHRLCTRHWSMYWRFNRKWQKEGSCNWGVHIFGGTDRAWKAINE
jgi:hypothetical protein